MMDIELLLQEMALEEKANFVSGKDFWHTQDIPRLGIPSVMVCDGPNGLRKQSEQGDHLGLGKSIETVCYPTASAMASSFDRELLRQLGEHLGRECQAEHIAMLLGPGVNMKRSPLCGRNFEYYSEDPYQAGEMAEAYIQGLQGQGVAACVKHFALNNQETRRMSGSSQADERTMREIYFPAFEKAVCQGKTRAIMNAYNAVNGTYCAENRWLLTEILRKNWGFDGFVVTDWGAIKNRVKGLQAGVDLEMPGAETGKTKAIVDAVQDGSLPEEVLDQAVRNLLSFVKTAVENQQDQAAFDREEAHAFSAHCAAQSAVLLKNEGLLPLKETEKVVFIGRYAREPRFQGAGSSHINAGSVISALDCADGLHVSFEDGEDIASAVRAASQADAAVVFAGLPELYEAEACDREHLDLPEEQNELIRRIAKVQKNTVVVLHGGSAMRLPWKDDVRAILLMHLGGDGVGKATVDLLYGRINPSGHLSETWPLLLEDTPAYLNFPGENGVVEYREGIYIGYRYYDKRRMAVAFPFGHGLSYTAFQYSGLELSAEQLTCHEALKVSCRVKNSGAVAGQEVVQLYLGAVESEYRRPVRELKGFEKIALQPGETKTVVFTLSPRDFAIWSVPLQDWLVESGQYTLSLGASSRDLRLEGRVRMVSDQEIPIVYDRNSTIGDMMKTARGRQLAEQLMQARKQFGGAEAGNQQDALGEGSQKIVQRMMLEMPLGALVSYGMMKDEQLDALIAGLNT